MNYKYTLEKTSKKHCCPKCNKKRFVRYIDNETNEYLDNKYGRCDRVSSCGYFLKPEMNPIKSLSVDIPITQLETSFINKNLVKSSLIRYPYNNFYQILLKYFDEDRIIETFKKYKIGTSKKWNSATVFWQIDDKLRVRTGKIMLFDIDTNKRVKTPFNHIHWVHSLLKIKNYTLKQCLFGLHLTGQSKPIAIVESEKTALFMDLFMTDCNWLSTGSKQNLKEELLEPIKTHDIVVYPDKGEYHNWKQKCDELLKKGYKIRCSDFIENSDLEQGADLADVYIQLHENRKAPTPLTEKENLAKEFSKINPQIKALIDVFELADLNGNRIRTELF